MGVKRLAGVSVRTACRACGRHLGTYTLGREPIPGPELAAAFNLVAQLAEALEVPSVDEHPLLGRGVAPEFFFDPGHWTRRGARTGTGLYLEEHAGRRYIRIRCKCGRDEKISLEKVPADRSGEPLYL